MGKLHAVLFDMDGTVLDTLDDLTDSLNATLLRFGYPQRSRREVAALLGNGASELVHGALPEGAENGQEVLEAYKAYYRAHCAEKTHPYDGIVPLMRSLHTAGIKVAVVSNKPDVAMQALCAEHFGGMTDFAIGERAPYRRKPAPDMARAALETLGADPSEAVYVGDTEVDVQTGRNAGMPVLAVSWGFRTREQLIAAGAQHIVDSAAEAERFLLRLAEN